MALLETLKTPPQISRGGRSVLDIWTEQLAPEDRAAVIKAARNPQWRHSDLLEALVAEGAPRVADTTFGVWRRKVGLPRDSR